MKKTIFVLALLLVTSISLVSCSSNSSSDDSSSTSSNLPVLTTTVASSITDVSATIGGNISSDGGNAITARGLCWSTTANPTTANSKTTETGTTGAFSSNLTSLTANTIYYARAYATNSSGTAYGNQIIFSTLDMVTSISFKYNNVQYSYVAETYDDTKKEIRGSGGINQQYKVMHLYMPLSPTVGVHNVTYDSNNPNPNSYEGHFVSQAEALYLDGTTGTINITSITSTKIEGTFSFTGTDGLGASVSITNGTFSARRNE